MKRLKATKYQFVNEETKSHKVPVCKSTLKFIKEEPIYQPTKQNFNELNCRWIAAFNVLTIIGEPHYGATLYIEIIRK